jgi:lysine 2,3-aminomutase
VDQKQWSSWRWQLKHRITTLEDLERNDIHLTEEEIEGVKSVSGKGLGLNITPYYLQLVDKLNPDDPIRRTVIPRVEETDVKDYEMKDPLSEDRCSPIPGLVHRYPDRVLLLTTDFCAGYCRYCTRRRLVGTKEKVITKDSFKSVVQWLKTHKKVNDVIISGGDPLTLETTRLEDILRELYRIDSVDILRIGTKVPVTMPMRITSSLCNVLRNYHPLYVNINFIHWKEITPECAEACIKLSEAGIQLGSQTVLLKNVNDDVKTLKKLFHELLKIRVKPYYLYACDRAFGTAHFQVPLKRGTKILKALRGEISGFAIPQYVLDTPTGKVPANPSFTKELRARNLKEKR